jgi:hypothetical protein
VLRVRGPVTLARCNTSAGFREEPAVRHPEHAAVIERVLAIPPKRFDRALIDYLSDPEIDAMLAAPDTTTWTG